MPVNALRGSHVTRSLYEDSLKKGVKVRFHTAGYLLIQDADGKVTGIYAKAENG